MENVVADLLVRGVDETVVRALKERAGAHGRSAEAEHREVLAAALARPRKRSFSVAGGCHRPVWSEHPCLRCGGRASLGAPASTAPGAWT